MSTDISFEIWLIKQEKEETEYLNSIIQKQKERVRKIDIKNLFNYKDDYCWFDFYQEFNGKNFWSERKMLLDIIPKIEKVFARVEQDCGYIVKKDGCQDSDIKVISRNKKYTDMFFSYTKKISNYKDEKISKKVDIKFNDFVTKYSNYIPMYGTFKKP